MKRTTLVSKFTSLIFVGALFFVLLAPMTASASSMTPTQRASAITALTHQYAADVIQIQRIYNKNLRALQVTFRAALVQAQNQDEKIQAVKTYVKGIHNLNDVRREDRNELKNVFLTSLRAIQAK